MSPVGQFTKSGKARFCALCQAKFTKNIIRYNARHHCRDCKRTVCDMCSRDKNTAGDRICYQCKKGGEEGEKFPGEDEFSNGKSKSISSAIPLERPKSSLSDVTSNSSEQIVFPGEEELRPNQKPSFSSSSTDSKSKKKSNAVLGVSESFPGESEFRKNSLNSTTETPMRDSAQVIIPINSDSLDCMLCRTKFTTFTRKHHCRGCNRVICSSCWDARKICTLCQENGTNPEAYRKRVESMGMQVEFEQGAVKCNVCKDEFNWKRKRHHCRACGKTICNDCSKHTQKITPMDAVPSRVCDNCHVNAQSCSCCRMSKKNRVCGFWICFLMGVGLVLASAFDVGSLIGKSPSVFGAVYGSGNALVLLSTLFLWGPRLQAKRICDPKRGMTPFILYFSALGVTVGLVVGLKNPAPMFIIICMCIQLLAIGWYCLTLLQCCERKKVVIST